jgi:hypothetical protein
MAGEMHLIFAAAAISVVVIDDINDASVKVSKNATHVPHQPFSSPPAQAPVATITIPPPPTIKPPSRTSQLVSSLCESLNQNHLLADFLKRRAMLSPTICFLFRWLPY